MMGQITPSDGMIFLPMGEFLSMLLSSFVLGFSLRTLLVWTKLMWRIRRASPDRKHMAH